MLAWPIRSHTDMATAISPTNGGIQQIGRCRAFGECSSQMAQTAQMANGANSAPSSSAVVVTRRPPVNRSSSVTSARVPLGGEHRAKSTALDASHSARSRPARAPSKMSIPKGGMLSRVLRSSSPGSSPNRRNAVGDRYMVVMRPEVPWRRSRTFCVSLYSVSPSLLVTALRRSSVPRKYRSTMWRRRNTRPGGIVESRNRRSNSGWAYFDALAAFPI